MLTALKKSGYTTLMCGDGTNDVGALKQAHVGVALLNSAEASATNSTKNHTKNTVGDNNNRSLPNKANKKSNSTKPSQPPTDASSSRDIIGPFGIIIKPAAPTMQFDDGDSMVRLGDASIASPFTAKTSSIMSSMNSLFIVVYKLPFIHLPNKIINHGIVTHIIRQGRCTLVTTLQMFKILALNCLISAYTLRYCHYL